MRKNARKLTIFATILAGVYVTFVGFPTACANKRGAEVTLIHEGETAPFTGDLYPIGDSVRMAIEVEQCGERSKAALDRERALRDIEVSRVKGMADASAAADRERLQLLTAELDHARAWYRSTPFVVTVSVVSTVAVLLTSAYLIQSTEEVRF